MAPGGGPYTAPGFNRSGWIPWLFTTRQGVAHSSARGDTNSSCCSGAGAPFIYAGVVALYFLARALWSTDDESGKTVPSKGTALRGPKAGA
ncbi:hypothetical protein [Streptomyces caniscabiei]|uniref:hypothetical protein n=1 Tax=Streptomyces caniscabiei TaxID=2746961 RepID=UPI000765BB1D|nr:hypothetical protein [Streptomyces caniscabiei]